VEDRANGNLASFEEGFFNVSKYSNHRITPVVDEPDVIVNGFGHAAHGGVELPVRHCVGQAIRTPVRAVAANHVHLVDPVPL